MASGVQYLWKTLVNQFVLIHGQSCLGKNFLYGVESKQNITKYAIEMQYILRGKFEGNKAVKE